MVIITGLWFFLAMFVVVVANMGVALYIERGGMLQQNGNSGLNHKTTHCVAQLALHLAQPRLRCYSPFPAKEVMTRQQLQLQQKETKQVRRFFCKRH